MNSDTIAAVSTAMSPAGIGIVRISGAEAFDIADQIYDSGTKKKKKLSEQPSHTIHYGFIVDGEEVIDEVLVMLLRGPRSYTAGGYRGDQLPRRRLCREKGFGDCIEAWSQGSRARRIYQAGFSEWPD